MNLTLFSVYFLYSYQKKVAVYDFESMAVIDTDQHAKIEIFFTENDGAFISTLDRETNTWAEPVSMAALQTANYCPLNSKSLLHQFGMTEVFQQPYANPNTSACDQPKCQDQQYSVPPAESKTSSNTKCNDKEKKSGSDKTCKKKQGSAVRRNNSNRAFNFPINTLLFIITLISLTIK